MDVFVFHYLIVLLKLPKLIEKDAEERLHEWTKVFVVPKDFRHNNKSEFV